MVEKKHVLTYSGLKRYQAELDDLKSNRRREIAEKIKEAREQGDLAENAEYDSAMDEQRDIEARIEELEKLLNNVSEIIDEDEVDIEFIGIGCKIRILDIDDEDEMELSLVGSKEANSLQGKISNESPVGRALMGHRVGDIVEVETQVGMIQYKVLEIQKAS